MSDFFHFSGKKCWISRDYTNVDGEIHLSRCHKILAYLTWICFPSELLDSFYHGM